MQEQRVTCGQPGSKGPSMSISLRDKGPEWGHVPGQAPARGAAVAVARQPASDSSPARDSGQRKKNSSQNHDALHDLECLFPGPWRDALGPSHPATFLSDWSILSVSQPQLLELSGYVKISAFTLKEK
ncbi:unnamed protein product [Natator depressus]